MKTLTDIKREAGEELHETWPLAVSSAITAGDWVRLESFLETFADRLIEEVERAVDKELSKHTCYSERKDGSEYETGIIDGHRCARETAVEAFAKFKGV